MSSRNKVGLKGMQTKMVTNRIHHETSLDDYYQDKYFHNTNVLNCVCLNMQIRHYLINLHTFSRQKSKHWLKLSSKSLFYFVDILESKVFIDGIFISLFT